MISQRLTLHYVYLYLFLYTLTTTVDAQNLTLKSISQQPLKGTFQVLTQSALPAGLSSCWIYALSLDVLYFPPETTTPGDDTTRQEPSTIVSDSYTL